MQNPWFSSDPSLYSDALSELRSSCLYNAVDYRKLSMCIELDLGSFAIHYNVTFLEVSLTRESLSIKYILA